MTYWINPWEDAIPVTLEELAECHAGLDQLCGSANGSFLLTKENVLEHWRSRGDKLDAYILPQPSGYHSIGIRYGAKGSEYLSPAGDKEKVQNLLDKYLNQTKTVGKFSYFQAASEKYVFTGPGLNNGNLILPKSVSPMELFRVAEALNMVFEAGRKAKSKEIKQALDG